MGMCEEVSWEEVVEVLNCLRRGKAPGPDGILNEMVMYGGGRLNLVLRCESYPADWKRSLLLPLHDDDDNEEVGSYRGVALGCSLAMRVMERGW